MSKDGVLLNSYLISDSFELYESIVKNQQHSRGADNEKDFYAYCTDQF
jgi:hypothetical protein